ncbi:MAG: glycosyltransferase family 9 protein [Fusobacteriaceae bacterium]
MKNFIKYLVYLFHSIFYKTIKLKKEDFEKKEIIIVKIDLIGDFIIWLSSAEILRKKYINKKITLICSSSNVEIAKKSNFFNEVIGIDDKKFKFNLKYRLNELKKIKRIKAEMVINPNYSRDALGSDWIVRIINSEVKVGMVGDSSNTSQRLKKRTDLWYTKLVKTEQVMKHEVERNFEFLSNFFMESINPKISNLSFLIDKNQKKINGSYVVILLGTSNLKKQTDLNIFLDVIKLLKINRIVLCGLKTERKITEIFEKKCDKNIEIINLIGQTNLIESINIINKAKLVIGNDTGLIHVATSLKIPTIIFCGGGHYSRFFPYPSKLLGNYTNSSLTISSLLECFNCNWKCRYLLVDKKWKCIQSISINEDYVQKLHQLNFGENHVN